MGMRKLVAGLVLLCAAANPLLAEPPEMGFSASGPAQGAPAQLAHWAGLIGRWSTREEGLRADGSGWDPSKGADWDFFWTFDGWGIQDNYTSPPKSEAVEDESKRQRGTNLRIYDPTQKQWVMTWLTPGSKQPQSFTASSDGHTIVMLGDQPNPQGYHTRITFFDIAADSFEWKLEWSKDQQQWREVYRIHGTRK